MQNRKVRVLFRWSLPGLLFCILAVTGCTPTVQMAAPEEPITINLNVRIEHEIRVRVERELEEILTPESGLF